MSFYLWGHIFHLKFSNPVGFAVAFLLDDLWVCCHRSSSARLFTLHLVPSHLHCSDSITPSFSQVRLASSVLEYSQDSVLRHTADPRAAYHWGDMTQGSFLRHSLVSASGAEHTFQNPPCLSHCYAAAHLHPLPGPLHHLCLSKHYPSFKAWHDDIFPTKLLQLAQAGTNLFEFEQQIICAFSIIPVLPYFVF